MKSLIRIAIFLILVIAVIKLVKAALALVLPIAVIGIGGYYGLRYLNQRN